MTRTLLLLFTLFFFQIQAQIVIDGRFEDWESIELSDDDSDNDAGASGIDFKDVRISSDSEYLYLSFDVNKEINLQDGNKITLYIDTDENASTGLLKSGIGADIEFRFGDRYGVYYFNNNSSFFEHPQLKIISAPTVTSSSFEVLIRRDVRINGNDIFPSNSIRLRLHDDIASGDIVPNSSGGLRHTFNNNNSPSISEFSFSKPSGAHVRFMSFNVKRDNLFESSKFSTYSRIFKATQPDIIGIQEVYDHNSEKVRNTISQMMGVSSSNFYYDDVNSDVHVVSRYPIEAAVRVDGNAFFLINKNGQKILFCVAHLPCCDNDNGRQQEVDRIMAFIRDAKAGNTSIDLPNGSPIVIAGDLNLVGNNRQVETLLTGDIFYTQYGADFSPDWDGSDFEDALPLTTGMPAAVTWQNLFSDFGPGRLDYMIYSGSVMELDNAFSLNTAELSQDQLEDSQLQSGDSNSASDHFAIVGDFLINNSTPTSDMPQWTERLSVLNFGDGNLQLDLKLEQSENIKIQTTNVLGQIIATQASNGREIQIPIDLSNYNRGIYFISIVINGKKVTKKVCR